MWAFLVYLIVLAISIFLFRKYDYTWFASIVLSAIIALIFLSIMVDLKPMNILAGNQETALYYIITLITLIVIVFYAIYKCLGDRQSRTLI